MKLNFKKFGSGQPLIILHGLFGSLDNWQTLAKKYGTNFTTYIVDQRNHGRSPHTDHMSYEDMARDISEFMNFHQIERANFIGHSMGGKVVQQFAVQHPNQCLRIISADMGIREYERNHDEIFDVLLSIDLNQYSSRDLVDDALKNSIPDPVVRQFILKGLQRNGESYEWKFNVHTLFKHYDEIIKPLDIDAVSEVDILFLSGDKSDYVLEDDMLDIMDVFPNAVFDYVTNAGHWLHAESPDEFFLRSNKYLIQ